MHETGARFGESGLLARLRRHGVQLGKGMAQIVLVRTGAGELFGRSRTGEGYGSPLSPGGALRHAFALIAAEGVEQLAVGRLVEQSVLLELALYFHQHVADLAQQPDTCRLIIDEGAAAPIGAEHAAKDERAIRRRSGDPVLGNKLPDRMIRHWGEFGRNDCLLRAAAHETALCAHAEGEAERIEQDRLACAGFAGEDAQSGLEGEIEPFDQHEVPNRQAEQHKAAGEREGPMTGMITGAPVVDQSAWARRFAPRARRHLRGCPLLVGIVAATGCVPIERASWRFVALASSPVNNRKNTGRR